MLNPYTEQIIERRITTKNKVRKIYTYISEECELKKTHRNINCFLYEFFTPSVFSKAYIKGSSIYENAKAHMYNDYFIMLDIRDFFPTISHKLLEKKMFKELNKKRKNCISLAQCKKIIRICSIDERGLPLGFITSPVLSNIYMKEFDCIVYGKIRKIPGMKEKNIIYTRYADDMIISFKWTEQSKDKKIEDQIISIINDQLKRIFLKINTNKTRSYILNVSNHVKVTGVNISKNDNNIRILTVGRKIKNELFWEAVNAYEAQEKSRINYIKGLQSFILSIEKCGYEKSYSNDMMQLIKNKGFSTLKELVDSL